MVYLILRPTVLGERAFPIEQSEINEMMKAGTIKRLPDGMYKQVDPPVAEANVVKEEEAPASDEGSGKRKYSRKDLRAE